MEIPCAIRGNTEGLNEAPRGGRLAKFLNKAISKSVNRRACRHGQEAAGRRWRRGKKGMAPFLASIHRGPCVASRSILYLFPAIDFHYKTGGGMKIRARHVTAWAMAGMVMFGAAAAHE